MTVDRKKCICCGLCVNSCPVGAISFKDGRAHINKEICVQCGYCKQICPEQAIEEK